MSMEKLPSEWNDDTIDKHILDGMYRSLNLSPMLDVYGGEVGEDDDAAANLSSEDVSEHPSEWIFPGWMAYRLFGPRAHVDYQSALFSIGDWPEQAWREV